MPTHIPRMTRSSTASTTSTEMRNTLRSREGGPDGGVGGLVEGDDVSLLPPFSTALMNADVMDGFKILVCRRSRFAESVGT